jgi:flagellar protein FlbD
MIKLTRLNNNEIYINAEIIKFVEPTPDTKISLIDRDMILVKESVEEVVKKINEYRACVGDLVYRITHEKLDHQQEQEES